MREKDKYTDWEREKEIEIERKRERDRNWDTDREREEDRDWDKEREVEIERNIEREKRGRMFAWVWIVMLCGQLGQCIHNYHKTDPATLLTLLPLIQDTPSIPLNFSLPSIIYQSLLPVPHYYKIG